jgi:hypothetical protein
VTPASLDALAQGTSTEARVAVAQHPGTSLESLAKLAKDHKREVRITANSTINQLPIRERAGVRAMIESPLSRLKSWRTGSVAK